MTMLAVQNTENPLINVTEAFYNFNPLGTWTNDVDDVRFF